MTGAQVRVMHHKLVVQLMKSDPAVSMTSTDTSRSQLRGRGCGCAQSRIRGRGRAQSRIRGRGRGQSRVRGRGHGQARGQNQTYLQFLPGSAKSISVNDSSFVKGENLYHQK